MFGMYETSEEICLTKFRTGDIEIEFKLTHILLEFMSEYCN